VWVGFLIETKKEREQLLSQFVSPFTKYCVRNKSYIQALYVALTRREQEIPFLYRWWDELR
jgi:hypothetical protein